MDDFRFSCQRIDSDINISWIRNIEECRFFSLGGPFDKADICNYVYPIRNNVTEFFKVTPSDALLDSLGYYPPANPNLDLEKVEKLCGT